MVNLLIVSQCRTREGGLGVDKVSQKAGNSNRVEVCSTGATSEQKKLPGMPMSEIWPGAKKAAQESIAIAEKSRHDQQLYGQCDPAY